MFKAALVIILYRTAESCTIYGSTTADGLGGTFPVDATLLARRLLEGLPSYELFR